MGRVARRPETKDANVLRELINCSIENNIKNVSWFRTPRNFYAPAKPLKLGEIQSMPDGNLVNAVPLAVAAYFAGKGIDRLIGPTLSVYGGALSNLAEKANQNWSNICARAIRKLGSELYDDGQISPRLLHHLVEGAPYCEDEFAQEYFAGIIASSRTVTGDDSNIHYSALINRLPNSQIRLHYFIYRFIHDCYRSANLAMNVRDDRASMPVYIPIEVLLFLVRSAFKIKDWKVPVER